MSKNASFRCLYSVGVINHAPAEGERHMMNQKAIIYCRVSESKKREILLYQQELLTKKAIKEGYAIYSQIKVCGKIRSLDFYEMKMLLNHGLHLSHINKTFYQTHTTILA